MGKKLYPTDTLPQAKSILSAWNLIDPSLVFGPLTSESLSADVSRVHALQQKIIRLQNELLDTRNQRDAACIDIWDKVKRARAGIKATYGDDSTEYEIAGGTRLSERKPPRRKASLELNSENSAMPE
jgi:hypothetical protein